MSIRYVIFDKKVVEVTEMDDFFQIIAQNDGIIATIITGIFTFFITKYTYHKNAPLDKHEISYDRIYYPIYRLIRSNKNLLEIVEKSELYLLKYNKYADRSTIKSFEFLKENMTDKDAYNAPNLIFYGSVFKI